MGMGPFDCDDMMAYYCEGYREACKQLLAMFCLCGFPSGTDKDRFKEYCGKRIDDMGHDIVRYRAASDARKDKEEGE